MTSHLHLNGIETSRNRSEAVDQPESYDLLVLGSGQGSVYLAWALAKEGQRVVVVDRKYIGGSCPNIACLPSKNVIHSAKVASYFQRSSEFGISKANYTIDMAAVRDRKRKMVARVIDVHLALFESGAELVIGSGTFVGPKTLQVTLQNGSKRLLYGDKVVIGTGTRARLETVTGLVEAKPMTHIEALELDLIPEHLLILGGGYVGLEFTQAMRRFGSRVTLIVMDGRLLSHEDEDVSEALRALLEDDGVEILLGAHVERVSGESGKHVRLEIAQNGLKKVVEGTHLLVATGRMPNTEHIGLRAAGVEVTSSGHIKVNERLETTSPSVWAIGECAGSPAFTHIAYDDFRVIHENFAGGARVTTGRQVPFCLFTDPELAKIGLDETQANKLGIAYRVAKLPMASVSRAETLSETRGFLKALIALHSDEIIGFTAFGVGAGEIMGAVQIAMIAHLPYTSIRDAILTHPTLLESLGLLFSTVPPATTAHLEGAESALP